MEFKKFIGREQELERLNLIHKKQDKSLIVVKGRRRIGKSRLIVEFANKNSKNKFWSFAGLAPQEGSNDQIQRDHFARQIASNFNNTPFTFNNWSDAFESLGNILKEGDIILFDEISWMAYKDPTFIPKLKFWWDEQKIPVTLIFCGSVSTWIEDNILKSTAFFGRINLTINLEPLNISESYALLKENGFQGSDYDIYKILCIMGGVPWYLEQIPKGLSANDAIKQLCFESNGLLLLEFNRIFHDLFDNRGKTYKKILESLKYGMKTLAQIRQDIAFANSGTLSNLMQHLIIAGFVRKENLWSFKTLKNLKQSLYRISDPYMRFYLKLIEPERNRIELGNFQDFTISQIPGFDAYIGLQLEQLLLQNRLQLLRSVGININDVIANGPYRQFKTTKQKGCQIDYLIQTKTKNLFICEFKFKNTEVKAKIIDEMKQKISALKAPKGFATIPVLFHIGGVSTSVEISGYFYRIIDISEFLKN